MIDILDLLKRLEWAHALEIHYCPSCCGVEHGPIAGHRPDCQLAAAILQLEAQREGIEQLATRVMDGEIRKRMGGMAADIASQIEGGGHGRDS